MLSSKFLYITGTILISVSILSIVVLLALVLPYGTPTNLDLSIVRSTQVTLPTTTPYPTPVPWKGSGSTSEQYGRTPGPTRTPELGMLPIRHISSFDPSPMSFTGRWRGWIDGKLIEVSAGSEGSSGNPMQGIVAVDVAHLWDEWPFTISDYCCMQIYRMPDSSGALFIQSVDGSRVTLGSEDGRTYVFDLEINDWVVQGNVRPTAKPDSNSVQSAGMRLYSRVLFEDTAMHSAIFPRVWTDAGSENSSGDPQQGILRITREREGSQLYPTPRKVGPIRIVSLGLSTVVVTSLDGQYTFYFDLPSRTWVSSNPTPSVLKLP
jgi:hypothetical protein